MALIASAFILALMVNFGGLLITFFYDPRYHEAAWMVPILALGLWQTLLYQTTYPVLLSLGKSKYGGIGNGVYAITMLVGIYVSFHIFGLVGGIAAVAAGDLPLYFIIQIGVTRQNLNPWRQDLQMTLLFAALTAGLHFLKPLL
jgi:O-antigen/teichoic acid export membrane protein